MPDRSGNPEQFAAAIKKRIDAHIRRKRFVSWWKTHNVVVEIEAIKVQIERTRLVNTPASAWKLANRVVSNDGGIIEACDDSDGMIGRAIGEFCLLWLNAASRMGREDEYWLPDDVGNCKRKRLWVW